MRGPQPWRTNRSRALRSRATSAEQKLWGHLRGRQLSGVKFVRQAPIGPFFADFLCRDIGLIVEVDGETHSSDAEIADDKRRASALERTGYRVFRVWNDDVYHNIDGVLEALVAVIDELKASTT